MMNQEPFNASERKEFEECASDPQRLRAFCAGCSREQLDPAAASLLEGNQAQRAIVLEEIDRRDLADAERAADIRHVERNFSSKLTHRLAILAAVIIVIALAIAAMEWAGFRNG